MARTLFVTVGTSAITNRELWEKNGDLPDCLPQEGDWGELIRRAESDAIKDLTRHGRVEWMQVAERVREAHADFEKAITDLHRKFWGRSAHQRREHLRRTSAEAISTWLAGIAKRMDGGPLETGVDKVVLVVSRSCVGQMAGRINETIFREHLFSGDGKPDVWMETVDDLRVEGIRETGDDAASLSEQVGKLYGRHTDLRAPLFNITGGFKGLIPAITVLCAAEGRTMLYMHDSMSGTIRLRFTSGRVEEDYEEMHAGD